MPYYEWKPGGWMRGDAQAVGERLDRVREAHGGALTAPVVVDEARPEESPLHPYFEWDDSVAAEEHRKEQARHLLRAIVVKVERPEIREPVRAYVVVREDTEDKYVPVTTALADDRWRQQVLARAHAELRQFRARYQELQELANVLAAIDGIVAA